MAFLEIPPPCAYTRGLRPNLCRDARRLSRKSAGRRGVWLPAVRRRRVLSRRAEARHNKSDGRCCGRRSFLGLLVIALEEAGGIGRKAAAGAVVVAGAILVDARATRRGLGAALHSSRLGRGVRAARRSKIGETGVSSASSSSTMRSRRGALVVSAAASTVLASARTSSLAAGKGLLSNPVAMTVMCTSSSRFSSIPAPKMMLAFGIGGLGDHLRGFVDVDNGGIGAAGDVDQHSAARRRWTFPASGWK